MAKKDQRVKCVLVDPPDQISDMTKSRQAPRATEMHEVYPTLGLAYIAATLSLGRLIGEYYQFVKPWTQKVS